MTLRPLLAAFVRLFRRPLRCWSCGTDLGRNARIVAKALGTDRAYCVPCACRLAAQAAFTGAEWRDNSAAINRAIEDIVAEKFAGQSAAAEGELFR